MSPDVSVPFSPVFIVFFEGFLRVQNKRHAIVAQQEKTMKRSVYDLPLLSNKAAMMFPTIYELMKKAQK